VTGTTQSNPKTPNSNRLPTEAQACHPTTNLLPEKVLVKECDSQTRSSGDYGDSSFGRGLE
jgi:hypothetical protein